jgi:drug/metabolite transporter (DMT)-like permease
MNPWTPLVAATVGWAASAVLSRAILLRGVNTWTLIPIRMVLALATLGVVISLTGRFVHTNGDAWRRGLVLGTVAMAFPMVLMTLATEDLPVTLGSLLIALVPLATIGAAHFLVEGERFRAKALPGLLIALIGSALLVGIGGGSVEGVGNLWRGVALILSGVLMAGIGGALSRRFALEVPSDQLVLPQFTVNTVVVVVLLPLFFDFDAGAVDGTSWLLLIALGVIGTTVAFTSFLIGAGVNPASRLALTGYAVPVVAVALAVTFLGEKLTPAIVGGAILIIIGVVLAERSTKHVPEPGVATAR